MINIEEYRYKTELHLHTSPASACSVIVPQQAVEEYAKRGYHSIMITNHFNKEARFIEDKQRCIDAFNADYEMAVEAGKKLGINVIWGCELRFTENNNDYLLFGIDESFLRVAYESLEIGIEAFSEMFRDGSRLLIQAHPLRKGTVPVDPKYLDGIEAFNMSSKHANNPRCAECAIYARENNLIMTAGSDCHRFEELGLAALCTKTEMKTSHDIAKVLRKRDYIIEIGGCILLP